QGVGSVCVVSDGDLVKIRLGSDRGQRPRPRLRHNKSIRHKKAQKTQKHFLIEKTLFMCLLCLFAAHLMSFAERASNFTRSSMSRCSVRKLLMFTRSAR